MHPSGKPQKKRKSCLDLRILLLNTIMLSSLFLKSQMEILTKIPKVLNKTQVLSGLNLLPAAGLEPARGCPQQILSLPRLPFRHAGIFC